MSRQPPGTAGIDEAAALIHRMLGDEGAGWSVGTFGAIAEFHCVDADPPAAPRLTASGGEVVTVRGGLRIALTGAAVPVAFEQLSRRAGAWSPAVAFCLPRDAARLGHRAVLTELGRDTEALRDGDRDAVLFDLGVGAPHIDFCVRAADAELIAELRRGAGEGVFAAHNRAVAAIKAHDPHRVCVSRLGRVEVYQPIPAAGPGAASPAGPHTHLLPEFLKAGRTHSANTPVPDGWISAFDLHPASPLSGRLGQPRPLDRAAHAAFQEVLAMFAPPGYMAEKRRIRDAVRAGLDPAAYRPAATRAHRRAARVALRQLSHLEPETTGIEDWLAAFDRGSGVCRADN